MCRDCDWPTNGVKTAWVSISKRKPTIDSEVYVRYTLDGYNYVEEVMHEKRLSRIPYIEEKEPHWMPLPASIKKA